MTIEDDLGPTYASPMDVETYRLLRLDVGLIQFNDGQVYLDGQCPVDDRSESSNLLRRE